MPETMARVGDLDVCYETFGDPQDPAVLLIMGLATQMIGWHEDFCRALADRGFHVIRYDNRDVGRSSSARGRPPTPWQLARQSRRAAVYTLEDMAADGVGLLDALGIERAHVVGASMGGMIAQLMASRFPDRVLSLTSMMSTTGRRSLPGPTRAVREVLVRAPRHPKSRRGLVDHMVEVLQAIGSPAYPTPEAVLRRRVLAAVERNVSPGGVLRQLVAIAGSGERCTELQHLRVRTLVIHGAADPLVPVECGIDTASQVDGAQLEVIEGMGHDIPSALIERLVALIDAHAHGKMAFDPIVRLFEKQ